MSGTCTPDNVAPIRCLTFDVEEYFHIEAARTCIARTDRHRWPACVDYNVGRLLDLLAAFNIRATWFILGDVARRHPRLASRIASAGHEIACHGDQHDRLDRLTSRTLRQDLLAARHRLEDQVGVAVLGYRAPCFSLTRRTAWAVDVIREAGFLYDASIFPVRHPIYGVPDAPTTPFWLTTSAEPGARLLELPPLTLRALGRNWPVAGGAYFRILPPTFTHLGLAQAQRDHRLAILYFHPWEFDPATPAMPLSRLNRLRTYTGLRRTTARLRHLLEMYPTWYRLTDCLPTFRDMANRSPHFTLAAKSVTTDIPTRAAA